MNAPDPMDNLIDLLRHMRGMCADEEPHHLIDGQLAEALAVIADTLPSRPVQPVERPRPEDFAEQAVSLAGKKALYDHAAGVERPRDAEAVERVTDLLIEGNGWTRQECLDYDAAGVGPTSSSFKPLFPMYRAEAEKIVAALGPVERPCEVTDASGTALIAAERERQITAEGWTPEHDDEHDQHEIAYAAACYAAPDRVYTGHAGEFGVKLDEAWPWERQADKRDPDVRCWYPGPLATALLKRPDVRDRRIRELVKAGALIAAEIDRLHRAALGAVVEGEPGGS